MSVLHEGDTVPSVNVHRMTDHGLEAVSTADFFKGRRVAVFSLPGAYTPTCSTSHVPRYNELQPVLAEAGIDEVVCISVNDAFVMAAWQRDEAADRLTFLADGNGDFTRGMGQLVEKDNLGFGDRSWRYSMIVKDGVIEKMFVEPHQPGDPYEVSDADTMLDYVAPGSQPRSVMMITKPGCGHCARARRALESAGLEWDELRSSPRTLRAVSGTYTTPRVFVDGELIGGADELIALLNG